MPLLLRLTGVIFGFVWQRAWCATNGCDPDYVLAEMCGLPKRCKDCRRLIP